MAVSIIALVVIFFAVLAIVVTRLSSDDEVKVTGAVAGTVVTLLGDVVKDPITGLEGTVISFHVYMTGCARMSVQPKAGKDNKAPEAFGVDVLIAEMVKPGPRHEPETKKVDRKIGGPHNDPHHRV